MNGAAYSRYASTGAYRSPYCYPGTETLINLRDLQDPEELHRFEEEMTGLRQLILEKELPVKGRFSVAHLKKLHHYIFQDVYPFAGRFRTEDIAKGATRFTPHHRIADQLHQLLHELQAENHLKGLDRSAFCQRLAYYMVELNMIHPFREGNGRTLRMFVRQLSIQCGYEIDWAGTDGPRLLNAMIAGVVKDYQPLARLIDSLIVS